MMLGRRKEVMLCLLGRVLPFLILTGSVWFTWQFYQEAYGEDAERISATTFLVLSVTLAVLVYYTYETYRIAETDKNMWELEIMPSGIPVIEMHKVPTQRYSDRVNFALKNTSKFAWWARVWCNFRIYDRRVDSLGEDFDGFNGKRKWMVYPEEISCSFFEIEPLLSTQGKTLEKMRAERTQDNRKIQLTMDLEIELKNEKGKERRYPPRHYFFDFYDWNWVPLVTE